ncbi:MAG TPA: adenosylcobinamide-GDP ribazoletransferase [Chondromyces sp.]|nr:adenosylcobinamide-GDP ribazoletransferase [Chondromyces sp.]
MKVKSYWYGFLLTVQFFSIIPVNKEIPMDALHLKRMLHLFPWFGLLKGTVYAGGLWLLVEHSPLSQLAIAFLIWLLPIILTGGLHLEGWMDASDAYFSYRDRERRLEIMKDPRVGAFGVLSLFILLAARFLFIYELVGMPIYGIYLGIAAIPFFSRGLIGMLLNYTSPARNEGLAFYFKQGHDRRLLGLYGLYACLFLAASFLWGEAGTILTVMLAAVLLFGIYSHKQSIRHFGGITGDLLGASLEGVETFQWMILWLLGYIVMG